MIGLGQARRRSAIANDDWARVRDMLAVDLNRDGAIDVVSSTDRGTYILEPFCGRNRGISNHHKGIDKSFSRNRRYTNRDS